MSKSAPTLMILLLIVSISVSWKNEPTPLLAHRTDLYIKKSIEPVDSMTIQINEPVRFGKVTDDYINLMAPSIEQFYESNIGNGHFSGGFIVAKNGKILFEKYSGKANYEKNIEMTKETSLHLASISKVFTAVGTLKLVEKGIIELDGKVQTYLPEYPYESTTVRMLLNHRSGLQHYSRFGEVIKGWNHKKTLTNQDVLNTLAQYKLKLVNKPNSTFNYNNTNYVLLALIIEKVTGMTYDVAMTEMIFKPLEMHNTFVFDYINQKYDVSQSYKSNRVNFGWDQFDALYGDKNIYSTPRDLVKFDLATYSDQFISRELMTEALKGYSYEKKGERNYGLGIRMMEFDNGEKLHFHNGWWHGNTTSYTTVKKDTTVIIALSNVYTQKVYKSRNLASLFADYPFDIEGNR